MQQPPQARGNEAYATDRPLAHIDLLPKRRPSCSLGCAADKIQHWTADHTGGRLPAVQVSARVLLRMGTSTQRVSLADLRAEVTRIRTNYLSGASLDDVDSAGFAEAFTATANRFRIKLAPEYAILTKATATLEGIIRTWHPHIDLVAIARPVVERLITGRWAPARLLAEAMTGATSVSSLLRGLPAQLEQLLQDVESGNLQVRAVSPALDELPLRIHQLASRLSLTGFAAALSICAALLVPSEARLDLRGVLCALCVLLAAGGWTALLWWHVLGRGRPLQITALFKLLRRD